MSIGVRIICTTDLAQGVDALAWRFPVMQLLLAGGSAEETSAGVLREGEVSFEVEADQSPRPPSSTHLRVKLIYPRQALRSISSNIHRSSGPD